MAGYIKLYRELFEHPVAHKDNDYLAVWLYLLSYVNYTTTKSEFDGEVVTLNPGQIITGRKKMSDLCKVDEHKIDRILKRLKSEQMIEQQTSSKNRLITVLNWSLYQNSEQQSEQQASNKWATSEQQVSTFNKNNKKERIKEKDLSYDDARDSLDSVYTGLSTEEAYAIIQKKPFSEDLTDEEVKIVKLHDKIKREGLKRI